ncbi:ABC transporter substrate-binding protein [Thermodesulfobacteriota bacterium]
MNRRNYLFLRPGKLETSTTLLTCRPFIFMLITIGFLVGLLYSCDRAGEPINIGLSISISGPGGTSGEDIRDGALLAVHEINKAGGINGRPLKLIIQDDQNRESIILEKDRELIEQGVIAIVGHSYSQNTLTAYPLIQEHDTLLLAPYTSTSKLTGKDDFFIRTSVDTEMYGKSLAILLNKRQYGTISFLLDISNAGFVEEFHKKSLKNFPGSPHAVRFNSKKKYNRQELVSDLLRTNPQAIILMTNASLTGMFSQRLEDAGYTNDLIASIWSHTPELIHFGSSAVEGLTLISFVNPDRSNPEFQAFTQAMQSQFHKSPNPRSIRAYEALSIIAAALKECSPTPTSQELKSTMVNSRFVTLLGPIHFDGFGDVVRPVYEIQINNGQFTPIGEIQ